MKKAFDWAARPRRNFTLREVFQHYVQRKPWEQINGNPLGFTRAGRLTERLTTGLGVAAAVGLTVLGPAVLPGLIAGAIGIGMFKVAGLAFAKATDYDVKKPKDGFIRMVGDDIAESRALLRQARTPKGRNFGI